MLLWSKITKYSRYEEMFERLRRRNITTAQMHLLLVLASRGDEWTTMNDLMSQLRKTRRYEVVQSSVSRSLQALGETNRYGKAGHDLLETRYYEEDSRVMFFRLNQKGLKFCDDLVMKL